MNALDVVGGTRLLEVAGTVHEPKRDIEFAPVALSGRNSAMRHALCVLMSIVAAAAAAAAEPIAAYQPLEFLAGSCWKGPLADGKVTDEHCFTWIYAGKFLRDRHVVHGEGRPDSLGETIYFWNSVAKQLEYLYVESDGGFSRGIVGVSPGTLVFPPTSYVETGQTRAYRSRWSHTDESAYDVVTEFQSRGEWTEGFAVHMVKVGAAPP